MAIFSVTFQTNSFIKQYPNFVPNVVSYEADFFVSNNTKRFQEILLQTFNLPPILTNFNEYQDTSGFLNGKLLVIARVKNKITFFIVFILKIWLKF